jgi:hypothetical protein
MTEESNRTSADFFTDSYIEQFIPTLQVKFPERKMGFFGIAYTAHQPLNGYLEIVVSCSAQTDLPSLQSVVEPGSTIHSESRAVPGVQQAQVNHDDPNFRSVSSLGGPGGAVHIKSYWNQSEVNHRTRWTHAWSDVCGVSDLQTLPAPVRQFPVN